MGTFSKNQNSASRNAANFNELRLTIESSDTTNNQPQQQTSSINQQIQYQQAIENNSSIQQHSKEDNDESVVEFFVNHPVLERATLVTHVSTEPNEKISNP